MKETVICPVCGYVTTEDRLGEVCPACGAKRGVFKPFEERVSKKRRILLNLKLHPMTVHFPQALSLAVFALLVFSRVVNHPLKGDLWTAVEVMMVLLPLSVLGAALPGILDGKTRFRRLGTPFLKTKLLISGIFLAGSLALALLVLLNASSGFWLFLLLSGGCAICSLILGKIGGKLGCLVVNG
jgi:rubredoxin